MKLLLRIFLLLLILTGCKLLNEEDDEKTRATYSTTADSLIGTWVSEKCFAENSIYVRSKMVFDGSNLTHTKEAYWSSDCTTVESTRVTSYTYTFKNESVSSTVVSGIYTMNTVAAVNDGNSSAFCGHADWVLNVSKSVTGKVCNGSQINVGENLHGFGTGSYENPDFKTFGDIDYCKDSC